MPQKQKDVIYDKLNRRGEPITHVTSPPPQLDKVYFPPKNIQFRVFTWFSRLLPKKFGCEDFCTFLEFFQLCPHLAPLCLYSGSRACESLVFFSFSSFSQFSFRSLSQFIFLHGPKSIIVFYHILKFQQFTLLSSHKTKTNLKLRAKK